MRDDDREQALFQDHTVNSFRHESVGRRALSVSLLNDTSAFCSRVLRQSCIHVRGGVLKFTHVVDNDTTVHDVQTYTVAFSPSVLIKRSVCPYHQIRTRTP